MQEVFQGIVSGFADFSALDLVNFMLGIVGVGLMIRRRIAAFPVGLVAVSVQGVLFYRSQWYADAGLQVFFFAALCWGWWHWVHGRGAAPELPISRLSAAGWGLTLALAGSATAVWATTLGPMVGTEHPWRDGFIAAFSVAAQCLQARKTYENWFIWMAVNVVAVASYWSSVGAFTALLYGIYLCLAVAGWRAWRRAMT